mgnify:CR=1 FL=1
MGLTADFYKRTIRALFPEGAAWANEDEATLTKVIQGMAEEPARLDARADDLMDEINPLSTGELLEDWERVTGLPDACTGLEDSLQERRQAVVTKLNTTGGQDKQYFIDLAATHGHTITIDEFAPFLVDESSVDNDFVADADVRYLWEVNMDEETAIVYFRASGSGADERIEDFDTGVVECLLRRLKPAHTNVIFSYP